MSPHRIPTLADVARMTAEGHPFDLCLADFLDGFYVSPSAEALAECPPLLASPEFAQGSVCDAYLAATAEELARACHLPCPRWTPTMDRALRRPYFASPLASLRAVLLLESPPAFRARNLFVSENALSRV
jgi:hypothetical protein